MTDSAIGRGDLWRYSVLAIPIAFAGFPLYVLAPDYYATAHGVSLGMLGIVLLGLRLFDAIQDPMIGALSDHYRHACAWVMGIASVILCAAMYGLFNGLPIHPVLWFSVCIATAVTAYSVLSINLNALGGMWTQDPIQQTRITGLREACGLIGLIVAVSLPSVLKEHFTDHLAYVYFCLILSGLTALAWVAFYPWLAKHVASTPLERPSYSLWAGLGSTLRPTRQFLGIYGLSMLASSTPAVLVIFFIRDLLGAEAMTGLFLLLYFISGAAAMPLWKRVSARYGKYRAWIFSMLLAVASFVWAFFLGAGDVWQYAVICIFSGVALGADLALPPSILADHIHEGKSQDHAATQYALLALAAKLSLALASAIALPLLGQAGFVPAAANGESALFALSAAYALIPCLLKLAAAAWLARLFIYSQQGVVHENPHIHCHIRSSHHA